MNEHQRKLLLVIAAREDEGKVPTVFEVSRMSAMNEASVRDHLLVMEVMGFVKVWQEKRGFLSVTLVQLAKNGKKLLPRVREINGQAQ